MQFCIFNHQPVVFPPRSLLVVSHQLQKFNEALMNRSLRVTPGAIAKAFFLIIGLLLIANLLFLLLEHQLAVDFHSVHIFYFNQEGNIPTVYSFFAILIAAGLLWLISNLPSEVRLKFYWRFLSILFAFLALDELLSIHESLSDNVRDLASEYGSGFLHFGWVIPYTLLSAGILIFLIRFLITLPPRTRYIFVLAAIVFISGAVGLEMAGGRFVYVNGDASRRTLTYALIVTLEELLEMVGVALFIYALFSYYIIHLAGPVQWTFEVAKNERDVTNIGPDVHSEKHRTSMAESVDG